MVKLLFEDKFVVLTGTWEGKVSFYIYPHSTVRKELSFEVRSYTERMVLEKIKSLFNSNDPKNSIRIIYDMLRENYHNVLGEFHEFLRKYDGRVVEVPDISLREHIIKLTYKDGLYAIIYITEGGKLNVYIDSDFPVAVDALMNQVQYSEKRIELLDGICEIIGELSDVEMNLQLDGHEIYIYMFKKHIVKPNSKLVFNCFYSKNNQYYRELTYNEPVLLSYSETSYGREPWYLR